jgi:catechol 2,3-dioxygenase-like lactoylglutathione lyase family enzyme
MIVALDHVQIAAPPGCEEQARHFYGDLLGLAEIPKPPGVRDSGGVWFRCGAQQLHIGVQEPFRPAVKAHPGLLVDERRIDELARHLQAGGVALSWDRRIPERRRFYTEDPWGNRLELTAPAVGAD